MGKFVDITGQKFHKLTVLKLDSAKSTPKNKYWICQCDCGTIKSILGGNLKAGRVYSCGCYNKEKGHNKIKDLTNQKFGKLFVIEPTNKRQGGNIIWKCKCDCGNFSEVAGYDLTSGHTSSCGCKKSETRIDLTGKRFESFTVLECLGKLGRTELQWKCKCDCGNEFITSRSVLQKGEIKNCGCFRGINEIGNRYGQLTVIAKDTTKTKNENFWICQCDCGNTTSINGTILRSGKQVSCGCIKSVGEYNILQILLLNNISFKKEFSVKINEQSRRFDFAIFDKENNLLRLVEFDGEQHYLKENTRYYDIEKIKQHDTEKNNYAFSNNIPLVRIPYWERHTLTLEKIMGDKYLITPPTLPLNTIAE